MILAIILLVISLLCLIGSFYFFQKTIEIKHNNQLEQRTEQQIKRLESHEIFYRVQEAKNQFEEYLKKTNQLKENISTLHQEQIKVQEELKIKKANQAVELKKTAEERKEIIELKLKEVEKKVNNEITNINSDLNQARISAEKEKKQLQSEIEKMRSALSAGVEARLREEEKKNKLDFYKISLSENDLADIGMLEQLKKTFRNPTVISKLIWSQYFQKPVSALCNKILGSATVCGIYKITNLTTEQVYIGQSLNIADRWKQHCKCGLGIDAPATNLLYKAMQKDGLQNFTFQLLEKCSRDSLNEKEAFWIETYQSNKFGYNSNAGIKKK